MSEFNYEFGIEKEDFELVLDKFSEVASRLKEIEDTEPEGQAWQDAVLEIYDLMGQTYFEWQIPVGLAILVPNAASIGIEHCQAEYGGDVWVPYIPYKTWHVEAPNDLLADRIEAKLDGVYAYADQFRCRVDRPTELLSTLRLVEVSQVDTVDLSSES